MKLLQFLNTIRKQGADLTRITLRVKGWPGAWDYGVVISELKGNRMNVLITRGYQEPHEVQLGGGHDVLRGTVISIKNQPIVPRRLRDRSSTLILDVSPPVELQNLS